MPAHLRPRDSQSSARTPTAPEASAPVRAEASRGNAFLADNLTTQSERDATVAGVDSASSGQTLAPVAGPAAPVPAASPLPVVEGVQRRTILGVEVTGTGVSPSALDACEAFLTASLAGRPDIQNRLAHARVRVVILPRAAKMTDVAEFASLRGQHTFDGRLWDEVRGSGGLQVGKTWAIGVAEETLIRLPGAAYGEGTNVGLHEFAHTLHSKGMSRAEQSRVTSLYEARRAAGGPWTESYGASNEQEYFAQGTNCFFRQNAGIGQDDPAWLLANDPGLYNLLVELYGAPPPARESVPVAGVATGARGLTAEGAAA